MPNHTINVLCIMGTEEQIAAAKAMMAGKSAAIDFDRIVPRPEGLHRGSDIFLGSDSPKNIDEAREAAEREALEHPKAKPDDFGKWRYRCILSAFESEAKTGYRSGMDWQREHWGTKWNAYDVGEWRDEFDGCNDEHKRSTIRFETAWSEPRPIINRLAELLGDMAFVWYADDEGGFGNLVVVSVRGELAFEEQKDDSVTSSALRLLLGTRPYHFDAEEEDDA